MYKYLALFFLSVSLAGIPGAFWAGEREGRLDERGLRTAEIVTALTIQREAIIRQEREAARKAATRETQHRKITEGVNNEQKCGEIPLSPCWRSYLERLRQSRETN